MTTDGQSRDPGGREPNTHPLVHVAQCVRGQGNKYLACEAVPMANEIGTIISERKGPPGALLWDTRSGHGHPSPVYHHRSCLSKQAPWFFPFHPDMSPISSFRTPCCMDGLRLPFLLAVGDLLPPPGNAGFGPSERARSCNGDPIGAVPRLVANTRRLPPARRQAPFDPRLSSRAASRACCGLLAIYAALRRCSLSSLAPPSAVLLPPRLGRPSFARPGWP